MLKKQIVNIETGDITFEDFTEEELLQFEKDKAESERLAAETEAKEAARQALLGKLGLTADEAKLLLS